MDECIEEFRMLILEYGIEDDKKLTMGAQNLKQQVRDTILFGINNILGIEFESIEDFKNQLKCGCGICLAHNSMICPKLKR